MKPKFAVLPLARIHPNPDQPRKFFDEESLRNLADSIAEFGVKTPIQVRFAATAEEGYIIIAGERRWRASKMAGKTDIPAIIQEGDSEVHTFEQSLIENVQRQDLNVVEEGASYKKLREMGYTYEEITKISGRSLATVMNYVKIVELPAEIQDFMVHGVLPYSYYVLEAIRSLPAKRQVDMCRQFVARHTTATAIIRACRIVSQGGEVGKGYRSHHLPKIVAKDDIPAIRFAGDEVEHVIRQHGMKKETLNWVKIIQAAEVSCNQKCDLRDGAREGDCICCPMIDFFKALTNEK